MRASGGSSCLIENMSVLSFAWQLDGWHASVVLGGGLYLVWLQLRLRVLRRHVHREIGPRWLAKFSAACSAAIARYVSGVAVASFGGEGMDWTGTQCIYVWHPHGFISFTASMIMGEWAVGGRPHGFPWFGMALPVLFKLPWLGEHFTLANGRPVDRASLERCLDAGMSVAINPGGVKEQSATRHDQEQAFFSKKMGFVKLAIKHGIPLMPLYIFGENQMYERVDGKDWITRAIRKLTGMTFPVCTGRFGLLWCFPLPNPTELHVRWGKAVPVGDPDAAPSDEKVQAVFDAYVAELQAVFHAHAPACLPPDVAKRGLKVAIV